MKTKNRRAREKRARLSSPRVDGNAQSARTIISRVEKSVIDARNLGPSKISRASLSTCSRVTRTRKNPNLDSNSNG
jgi:hypothetical protein